MDTEWRAEQESLWRDLEIPFSSETGDIQMDAGKIKLSLAVWRTTSVFVGAEGRRALLENGGEAKRADSEPSTAFKEMEEVRHG